MPGCITGLIGQNGAGKSTTFKAALGLISADGGTIRIFGKDVRDLSKKDKEKIGVVLSDSGFSGYLSIKDIVPIMENMYEEFEKAYFLEQCEHFGLPVDKKIKAVKANDVQGIVFQTGTYQDALDTVHFHQHKTQLLIQCDSP